MEEIKNWLNDIKLDAEEKRFFTIMLLNYLIFSTANAAVLFIAAGVITGNYRTEPIIAFTLTFIVLQIIFKKKTNTFNHLFLKAKRKKPEEKLKQIPMIKTSPLLILLALTAYSIYYLARWEPLGIMEGFIYSMYIYSLYPIFTYLLHPNTREILENWSLEGID